MTPEQQAALDRAKTRLAQKRKEAKPLTPSDRNSVAESSTKGFADGASFGFLDEGAAAILAPFYAEGNGEGLTGYLKDIPEAYTAMRDAGRESMDQARADNPVAYGVGELGGGVATGVAMGGGTVAGRALPAIGETNTLTQAMRTGTAYGAAYGLGNSDAALSDTSQVLTDVAAGGGMGMAGGAGGYALGKFASSPTMRALLSDESGAVSVSNRGGHAMKDSLTPAQTLVYRALVEEQGLSPEQAAQIVSRAGQAGDSGIPLSLPEAADNPTLLAMEKRLRQNAGPAGQVEQAFTKNRAMDALPEAYQSSVQKNIGPITSPEAAGKRAAEAATGVISKAEAKRSEMVRPLYEKAYQQTLDEPTISKLLENPVIKSAYDGVKRDPVWQAELAKHPPGSVGMADATKRYLDDMAEAASKSGERGRLRIINEARSSLTQQIDEISPAYKLARKSYEKASPRIDKLRNSVVGMISDMDAGDYGKAADTLFKSSPSEIRFARRILGTADAEGWNRLVGSHLASVAEKANHSPVKILNALSSKGPSGNVLKDKALDAALSPSQRAAKDRLFSDLERASRIRFGSDTATNRVTDEVMDDALTTSGEKLVNVARKGGGIKEAAFEGYDWFMGKVRGKQYEELARIFTGDGSEDFAKKILRTKPGSPQAYRVLSERIGKVSAIEGAATTTRTNAASEKQPAASRQSAPVTPDVQAQREAALARAKARLQQNAPSTSSTPAPGGTEPREPLRLTVPRGQEQSSLQQGNSTLIGDAANDALPADIRADEGLRHASYLDTTGHRTVGFGFNMDSGIARNVWKKAGVKASFNDVYAGRAGISDADAQNLGAASYRIAMDDARAVYPDLHRLSQGRQQALLNLSYQMGKPNLMKFRNFNAAVKAEKWGEAARHLMLSEYGQQTRGRAQEVARQILRG